MTQCESTHGSIYVGMNNYLNLHYTEGRVSSDITDYIVMTKNNFNLRSKSFR